MVEVTLHEINPNPWKKNINKGRLDEDTITRIQSNMKELGLMGALPVFKKDDKTYLIAGHHRIEALKREFGKDYQVEVVYHKYSDDNVLRGMVVENLTQRINEFVEEKENLVLIRKHLRDNKIILDEKGVVAVSRGNSKRKDGQDRREQNNPEPGSLSQIALWLNKNGEVLLKRKIADILNIADRVDVDIQEKIEKGKGGKTQEGVVSIKQAIELSKVKDKKEQNNLLKVMQQQEIGRPHEAASTYLKAPKEVKEALLENKITAKQAEDLTNISSEKAREKSLKETISHKKLSEITPKISKNAKPELTDVVKAKFNSAQKVIFNYLYEAKVGIIKSNKSLSQANKMLNELLEKPFEYALNKKTIALSISQLISITDKISEFNLNLSRFEELKEKFTDRIESRSYDYDIAEIK